MGAGLFHGGVNAGGLDDILGAALAPGDIAGVHLGIDGDGLAIDHQLAVLGLRSAFKAAMYGIILEHVYHIVGIDKRIVDAYDLDVGVVDAGPESQTTDTTKTVDTYFNCHVT